MSSELCILFCLFSAAGTVAALLIRLRRRKAKPSGTRPGASMSEFMPSDNLEAMSGEGHPEPAVSKSAQGERIADSVGVSTGVAGESGAAQEQDTAAAIANKQAAELESTGQTRQEGEEQPGGRAERRGEGCADSTAISADKLDQGMAVSTGVRHFDPVDAQEKAQPAASPEAKEGKKSIAIGAGSDAISSSAPKSVPCPPGTNAEAARSIPEPGSSAEGAGRREEDGQGDIRNMQVGREADEERVERPAVSIGAAGSGQAGLESGVAPAPPGEIDVVGRPGRGRDIPEEAEQSTELGRLTREREVTEPRATKTETTDASVQRERSSEKQTSPETAGPFESGGVSGPVVDAGAQRAPDEKRQHEPTTGKERAELDSDSGTLTRTSRKQRSRKKQPRKYRGLSREAAGQREAAPHQESRDQPDESVEQRRSLSIEVRIRFERGGFCAVSLIAKRTSSSPEDLTAVTSSGEEVNLRAMQDEWYQDIVLDDLSGVLRNGMVLTGESANGQYSWSLSGREIYVLAARPDISGYVSQPCLELGRDHVVLCTAEVRDRVEEAIQATGAHPSAVLDEGSGAPCGWLVFRGVVPASPVAPEGGPDIFNALRPLLDIKISLEGGIRLERGKWLARHPPSIRVYGSAGTPEVLIDGRMAERTGDGAYYSDGWDSVGDHSVCCGGKSCSYSIVPFEASWELFEAYTFPITPGAQQRFSVCGPVVRVAGVAPSGSHTICVPETNPVVLGPEPGQIGTAFKASRVRGVPCLATTGFVPVWALPLDPLHCDKQSARILFVRGRSPLQQILQPAGDPPRRKDADIERWYRFVLDASRKGLALHPDTALVRDLWQEYKKLARRTWRARK